MGEKMDCEWVSDEAEQLWWKWQRKGAGWVGDGGQRLW